VTLVRGARVGARRGAGLSERARRLTLPLATARRRVPVALALVIAVAATLRVWLLAANCPLHHDEALYGAWAQLIVSGRDPLLLTAWVDKPPLVIYALAASLRLFGVSEYALRLPGMIVSLATIACVYGLARRLYDARTALLASLLLALAPFAILFAPTTFTDPWLTLWLVAAVWAAVARRSFWAGVALGLAVASKQQGVLGAPIVAVLLLAGDAPGIGPSAQPARRARPALAALGRFGAALLGFALIFLPVTWWDSLRWAKRPSFWDRSLTTYGGLGLAPLAAWPERAADWAQVIGYLFGFPVLTGLMLGLAGFAALRDWRRLKAGGLLGIFLASHLVLHFLATFQPWDRYLLPLLPFICVLAARGASILLCHAEFPMPRAACARQGTPPCHPERVNHAKPVTTSPQRRISSPGVSRQRAYGSTPIATISQRSISSVVRRTFVIGLIVLLAWAAWLGATARLPVGSDHGAYSGLDRIAAFLRAQDDDAVIYQRWLGWHFDFYLFDAPQERRWWGAGWKLAGDAAQVYRATPDRAQWVVLPGWHDAAAGEVRLALASRGLTLAEALRVYRADKSRAFTVYRIVPDDSTDVRASAEHPGLKISLAASLRGATFATKQSPLPREIASAQTTGLAMTFALVVAAPAARKTERRGRVLAAESKDAEGAGGG